MPDETEQKHIRKPPLRFCRSKEIRVRRFGRPVSVLAIGFVAEHLLQSGGAGKEALYHRIRRFRDATVTKTKLRQDNIVPLQPTKILQVIQPAFSSSDAARLNPIRFGAAFSFGFRAAFSMTFN